MSFIGIKLGVQEKKKQALLTFNVKQDYLHKSLYLRKIWINASDGLQMVLVFKAVQT